MKSLSKTLGIALLVAACGHDEEPAPPVRRITPHALVWNGRDPGTLNDHGPLLIHVFDSPLVTCDALPRGAFAPVPPGVRLEVVIYPSRWEPNAGSAAVGEPLIGGIYPEAYDESGKTEGFAFSTVRFDLRGGNVDAPSFELLTAPKAKGDRARMRLRMRVEFSTTPTRSNPSAAREVVRIDEIDTELDAEICGDIE